MHPQKARSLEAMEAATRQFDAMLRDGVDNVTHPGKYGWLNSLVTATLFLPVVGISAMVIDWAYVMTARRDDAEWARLTKPPSDPESETPPNGR